MELNSLVNLVVGDSTLLHSAEISEIFPNDSSYGAGLSLASFCRILILSDRYRVREGMREGIGQCLS